MSRSDATLENGSPQGQQAIRRVVIAGGGLAGIAAAIALARSGIQVTLVESKRRLGGRAGSFVDTASGETIDYCQHVAMGCCTNLRQLFEWMGQSHQWQVQKELHFYGPNGQYQRLGSLPLLPAPLHLAGWLWSWPGLGWLDRWQVARGLRNLARMQLNDELDRMSALDWLKRQRQSVRAIDCFWSTVVVSALGEELRRVNLLAVAKVFQDGFLRHREAFHLLVPQRPLSHLFGSEAESVLHSLGVNVELSATVQQLIWFDGRCCGVRLTDGREFGGEATILAIPWHRYTLFKHDFAKKELAIVVDSAEKLASSPISGVHTWWDRDWLETEHAVIVGRLCQWVFRKNVQDDGSGSGKHYYQIVISASRQLSEHIPPTQREMKSRLFPPSQNIFRQENSQLENRIHDDLASVFPKAAKAKLLRVKAVTDPLAVFSVEPGVGSFRPSVDAVGGGVWLAGDWTQTRWPATMEGAVRSGFLAAERASQALGFAHSFVAAPLA